MKQRTLRRKLQKKAKHKPYRKCPRCGERMECRLMEGDHDGWHLWKFCGQLHYLHHCISVQNMRCRPVQYVDGTTSGCGYFEQLIWSGGGTGRHIPHVGDNGRGKA